MCEKNSQGAERPVEARGALALMEQVLRICTVSSMNGLGTFICAKCACNHGGISQAPELIIYIYWLSFFK